MASIPGLVHFLQGASQTNLFDRKSAADIYQLIGYQFGLIHGGMLAPEWTLRPDVTTLVAFEENQDAIHGYNAGRQWFFEEADVDEHTITDDQLIERLHELTKEASRWHDPEGVWFFTVGCLLGEVSGHLFPQTDQERQQWQAEKEAAIKEYLAADESDQESRTQETEPLPLAVLQEA